ncbi:MAG TPA: hypothetical protein VK357_05930, partial [Rubrobacteraceae bacterium]|nr:hypothetical protein [Rubrobacteraceae bacterium]
NMALQALHQNWLCTISPGREAVARSVMVSGISTFALSLVLLERRYGENIQELGIPFVGDVILH